MIISLFIDNINVNDPINLPELSIQLLYDRDNTSQQIEEQPRKAASVTRWEWGLGDKTKPNDAANIINDKIFVQGLVTEGIPFRIEIEDEGVSDTVFDGYLDPQTASYDCDRISIDAVEKKQIDWLNDVADSPTYEGMFNAGEFGRDKFVSMPCVISTIPNSFEAMLSAISLFTILFVLSSQLQEMIELIAGSANPFQFMDIVKLALRGIYIATQFVFVVVIIRQIANLLIQPVKYFESMYTRDLLEIGAAHYGFEFKSSIYDPSSPFYNEIIIPEKYSHNVNADKDDVLGWLTPDNPQTFGYYNGTFGDLLRILKVKYNAKIFFIGNQLRLERRDFIIGSPQYKLPPVDEKDFRVNANELISNRIVSYTLDPNDKNTYQRYKGTLTQAISSPVSVVNKDYVLLKSFEERSILFARGSRKNNLTIIEKIVKGLGVAIDPLASVIVFLFNAIMGLFETFFGIADDILSIINVIPGINLSSQDIVDRFNNTLQFFLGPLNLAVSLSSGQQIVIFEFLEIDVNDLPRLQWESLRDLIEERRGMLLIENDFLSVPKCIIVNENKEKPVGTNIEIIDQSVQNSEYLWDNFHSIDTFVPSTQRPNANQYKIYDVDIVGFCFQDYLDIRNNGYMFDYNDKQAELISIEWNIVTRTARIEYKINELYTNNVKVRTVTLDGK